MAGFQISPYEFAIMQAGARGQRDSLSDIMVKQAQAAESQTRRAIHENTLQQQQAYQAIGGEIAEAMQNAPEPVKKLIRIDPERGMKMWKEIRLQSQQQQMMQFLSSMQGGGGDVDRLAAAATIDPALKPMLDVALMREKRDFEEKKPLSSAELDDLALTKQGLRAMNKAKKMIFDEKGKFKPGMKDLFLQTTNYPVIGAPVVTPDASALYGVLKDMQMNLGYLKSGAQAGEEEARQSGGVYMPDVFDDAKSAMEKFKSAEEFLRERLKYSRDPRAQEQEEMQIDDDLDAELKRRGLQ